MGCSKNLIDSERLIRQLSAKGYEVCHDSDDVCGEYVVVNTCGFIADAKEESISVILDLARLKEEGKIKRIIVMGCLSQRYMDDLKAEIPEVDTWYGKFDWKEFINRLPDRKKEDNRPKEWERTLTTPHNSAYLKISEGCNRFCAFCAIPLITGRHHSRPVDEILEEVRELVAKGVREYNIIAQDLSSYGRDLDGGVSRLAELLELMAAVEGVEMIRLHYAYPSDFPFDILPVMAAHSNICKYLDIALQHIDNKVLDNMRRHIDADATRSLLARIRHEVPGIHIRTTMMVGFPGEDDEAFNHLVEFVEDQRFERLGAFAYCEEEGTFAANNLPDIVPEDVKKQRLDRLMEVQQDIAFDTASAKIGSTLRVIIDEYDGERYIGRTEYDSPEVDCCVFIDSSRPLTTGNIYNIEITDAEGFDLIGHVS